MICSPKLEYQSRPGHDDIMGLQQGPGQTVFGIDDFCRVAAWPGKRLEWVSPGRSVMQIDLLQELTHFAVNIDAVFPLFFHETRAFAHLRCAGHALVDVALHAGKNHRQEIFPAVFRLHDALQGMAGDASQQRTLFPIGPRHARHPLGIRELPRNVCDRAQIQIHRRDLRIGNPDRVLRRQLIACRAHAQLIRVRRQSRSGKAIFPILVRDDRHRDGRTDALRAHDHAFHRSFFL